MLHLKRPQNLETPLCKQSQFLPKQSMFLQNQMEKTHGLPPEYPIGEKVKPGGSWEEVLEEVAGQTETESFVGEMLNIVVKEVNYTKEEEEGGRELGECKGGVWGSLPCAKGR